MLDLSFELGVPLHELRDMPLRDLRLYQRYTQTRVPPGRKMQLLMAQVTAMIAAVNGNMSARVSDYLMDPKPEAERDLSDLLGQPIES